MIKGQKHTEKSKRKMSRKHNRRKEKLGYINSPKTRKNISKSLMGRKQSEEHRKNLGIARRGLLAGEKHPNWKGGVSSLRATLYFTIKYKQWRQDVFIRDSFTCQDCGDDRGKNLHAHHKYSFKNLLQEAIEYMPLLTPYDACLLYKPMWNINNGITICRKCHEARHKRKAR